jgi:hypothetical protein
VNDEVTHRRNATRDIIDRSEFWTAWDAWLRRLAFADHLPFSGDVEQWIKTWGEAVSQIGFYNVNIGNSRSPATENAITSRYSYGRQLGRIMDVLTPLVEKDAAMLAPKLLDDYREMVSEIESLKRRKGTTPSEIVNVVKRWPKQSPQTYRDDLNELLAQLQALKATFDRRT